MDNYWLILLAAVVGVLTFASRLKELKDGRKAIEEAGGLNSKYELIDYSKTIRIVYILLSVFGVGSGIYGFVQGDKTTAALGIIVMFLFLGEALMTEINFRFYYSPTTFYYKGKVVRYKSIKEIEAKAKIPMAFAKVVTFNGEKLPVPPKAVHVIEEHMKGDKKKK